MQLKSASLKSMQAMNRDLLQQQHHTDTTVLNTPSKNLQSVNVLVVHHHTTKKQGPFKIGISDEHSQCNLNIVFFSYIYTKTTGFQTSYKEKQYYSLRNHVSNLSLDIYDNLNLRKISKFCWRSVKNKQYPQISF